MKIILSELQQRDVDFDAITFEVIKPRQIKKREAPVIPMEICEVGPIFYNGVPMELTEEDFDEMVMNFNREENQIPLYFGHADVVASASGEEPPAVGWILGLQRVGKFLYGLCELTKRAEEAVEEAFFKFTSINMSEDVDRATGEDIGARLHSLAMTNQPFKLGLKAVSLSKNSKPLEIYLNKTIYEKETQMAKAKTVTLSAEEALETAQVAAQTMDEMQDGKVKEPTPEEAMQMLEEARGELSLVDFIKSLLDLKAKVEADMASEDEAALAATPSEDTSTKPEDEKEKETVAASTMLSRLNVALSNANARIKQLESVQAKNEEMLVVENVNEAIRLGKLDPSLKADYIELGNSNKKLFSSMLVKSGFKPFVALGRVTTPDTTPNYVQASNVASGTNENVIALLQKAGLKV